MLTEYKESEMSEQSIRKILSHAYNKAGKILGREFSVYRPVVLNDSLSDANFIYKLSSAFTLNKDFVNPQRESFKDYLVYTNSDKVEVGDIMADSEEVFVITWRRGIEDVVAIRATDIVEIYSTGWDTANGLTQTRILKAKNVPASVTKANSVVDSSLARVANTNQANAWEVRIWSKTAEILQTDNIIFRDGTILHIDSMSTNELCQTFTCSEVVA
jgi:hypothetical protein